MAWTLHEGDSFNILPGLEEKQFDLVLTDPPYALDWKEPITLKGRKAIYHHQAETEKWDTIENIKQFYRDLYKEYDRLVKETGSVLIFTRSEYISYAREAAIANNFLNKCSIYWHKTNPAPQVRKKNYLSAVEVILWVAREGAFTFNFTTQKEMHNWIEYPVCSGHERRDHVAQKPLRLIEHLIEVHSNPGDLILDSFAGTGTTGEAAERLGRNSVLIESDPRCCSIIRERMSALQGTIWGGIS